MAEVLVVVVARLRRRPVHKGDGAPAQPMVAGPLLPKGVYLRSSLTLGRMTVHLRKAAAACRTCVCTARQPDWTGNVTAGNDVTRRQIVGM